jgi:hypothetical protein
MRELIESSGLDGWLEGPSWGMPINPAQLTALLGQMQAQRRSAAAFGATMVSVCVFGGGGDNLVFWGVG